MSLKLPLPNETFKGRTIIASTWTKDDPGEMALATVLFLNPIAPYYTVAQLVAPAGDDAWMLGEHEDFPNINPAVIDGYAQWGGDY